MPEPGDTSASHSPTALLSKALRTLDRTSEHIEKTILGASVLFLAGLLIIHVLGRQLFGNGLTGQVELTQISLIIMTFAGLGYGVRRARHICMSAFYDQLSGWPRKALLVFITPGSTSVRYSRGRTSSALQIPLWIPYLAAPIGFALAGIQYWLTAIRNLTSRDIYRSFNEKEEYDAVPDDGAI